MIKTKLRQNTIDKQTTFKFLKDFAKKNVDGSTIYQRKCKNDSTIMNQFIADFGQKNEYQNIWTVVVRVIGDLPNGN